MTSLRFVPVLLSPLLAFLAQTSSAESAKPAPGSSTPPVIAASPATEQLAALTPAEKTALLRATVAQRNQLPLVTALLTAGADPLDRLTVADPIFIAAIKAGNPAYAEAMLDARPGLCVEAWPDRYSPTTVGMVALYHALHGLQSDLARRLLTQEHVRIDTWRPDSDARTPSVLGLAVGTWHTDIVKLLIEGGAEFGTSVKEGEGFFTLLNDYRSLGDFDRQARKSAEESAARRAASVERLKAELANASTPAARLRAKQMLRIAEEQHTAMNAAQRPDSLEKIRLLASFRGPRSPDASPGINNTRSDGASPLAIAVAENWPEVASILVAAGADLDRGRVNHRSILAEAAQNPAMLHALGNSTGGPAASSLDIDGPAYVAAIARDDAEFLENTAPNATVFAYRDPKGWSALHHAIKQGNDALALRLIAAGADIEAVSDGGQTPLAFAGFVARPAVARALLARHANPDKPAVGNGFPPLLGACIGGDAEIVRLLLEAKADPNATYEGGIPLLVGAAKNTPNVESIRLLVEAGARLDATDAIANGPLETAVFGDRADILAFLLDLKTPWQSARRHDASPLFLATQRQAWKCAHLLLERGERDDRALALATDPRFKAALEDALQASGSKTLDDAELWPAICADKENWKTRIDAHLANGGNVNYASADWTPLLCAIKSGDLDMVRYIIAKGADPRIHPQSYDIPTLQQFYIQRVIPPGMKYAEFRKYLISAIPLLVPLEPSPKYESYLADAIAAKRWEEAEAFVQAGVETDMAIRTATTKAPLSDEDRARALKILGPARAAATP